MAARVAWVLGSTVVLAGVLALSAAAKGPDKKGPNKPPVQDVRVGKHISGAVRHKPAKPPKGGASTAPKTCSTPGGTNFRTDCNSSGRPVNETWVTYGNGTYYAGANDYNSYNGQGQNGFYWSTDGVNWQDAGPLDLFPHDNNNGSGDPGLAVDGNGVVYYSSLFFNFKRCSIGGVELMRRDPSTGAWSYYQIAANSKHRFQDKPTIAVGSSNVYVSWTQFQSCSGSNVQSPIRVAILPQGATSSQPTTILQNVPGSQYSQGSSIASDGSGGFWIAWEEYPSASATTGSIRLAHYDGSSWVSSQTISPGGFTDLPSPLPGFAFRTDSFPALTVTGGQPEVAWTSNDSGVGRAYLWTQGTGAKMVSDSGDDQFFPSIAADGSGGVYVAYSQTDRSAGTYDQYLWHGGTAAKVSAKPSDPSNDLFFSGQFIGDYNGMVVTGSGAHPIWTDLSGSNPTYGGNEMDSMFYSAGSSPTPDFSISASPSSQTVTQGDTTAYTVSIAPSGGFSSTVDLSVSGLPTGASGTFSPSSTTSSSTLSIDTGTAAAGSYQLTITGTGGGTSHSTTVTLDIQSPSASPSFTLTASPSSQTIRHGQKTTFTVNVVPSGGFNGSVRLSVSGLPSHAKASFKPNPTSSSSTLAVGTKRPTPTGTYLLTITGTSGGLSATTTVTLVITN